MMRSSKLYVTLLAAVCLVVPSLCDFTYISSAYEREVQTPLYGVFDFNRGFHLDNVAYVNVQEDQGLFDWCDLKSYTR